jgi:hypothetical protein
MIPHFGQRILSKSIHTISAGEIDAPARWANNIQRGETFSRLILLFCIAVRALD